MLTGKKPPGKPLDASGRTLGRLDAEAVAAVVSAASDIALFVDRGGVIRGVALGGGELSREECGSWLGQPWADTVTADSRVNVEATLRDAASKVPPRWRHVAHLSARGADVLVEYRAVQVGRDRRIVALGRDLRPAAALQQRLIEAQQSMDRDYTRLRYAESRYRLLFETVSEAVLIVDAATLKVLEANAASPVLLGASGRRIVGRLFLDAFDAEGKQAVEAMLAVARTAGRADGANARVVGSERQMAVSAQLLRYESTSLFLVRLAPHAQDSGPADSTAAMLVAVLAAAPDALVVTDPEGRILAANLAFIDLAQLATEAQARGESLERWLGRPGVDLDVMIANLRQYGIIRLFATTLRGEEGSDAEVEISAVAVPQGKPPCLGFSIRNVGRRLDAGTRAGRELPRTVEQVTGRVGRVPLKEMVREATDLIERLGIESALELTHDNRAAAAEMLGLSRQSLYVKLRKYGLGDLADGAD